jgi:hypothetical protein
MAVNRRNLLQLGAFAALPRLPLLAQGQTWRPGVLDAHQNETVIALTDWIIPATDTPGAKAALVNRYIDLLVRDGSDNQRKEFLSGLAWLDGFALQRHQEPFIRCTPAKQEEILRLLDSGQDSSLATGRRFFSQLKSLTTRIYYATEIGFKELNKGGRVPASYGCAHPEHA